MSPLLPGARAGDRGFSLLELLIATAITCVVVPLVFGMLVAAQVQTASSTATAEGTGDIQVALATIDRRVRSASAHLYLPATPSGVRGFSFFTRFAPDTGQPTAPLCVQLAVTPDARSKGTGRAVLVRWAAAGASLPLWTSSGPSVAVVLPDVVAPPTSTAGGTSFAVATTDPRWVVVHLEVQHGSGRGRGRVVPVETEITARNPAEDLAVATVGAVATCTNFN